MESMAVRELYCYVEGTQPFMNILSNIALRYQKGACCYRTGENAIWNCVMSAIAKYTQDYCSENTSCFSLDDIEEVYKKVVADILVK